MKDFKRVKNEEEAIKRARSIYNHPNDSNKNLIYLAIKNSSVFNVTDGDELSDIPLKIIGPSEELYREIALAMVENFAEITDEPDFESYDENVVLDEEDSKSVIDEDDDDSITNMGSIMLLFTPEKEKFLLLGDATCKSIKEAICKYWEKLTGCIIKVPHHGSKHNMNTPIIDYLKPAASIISAKGSKKHPNSGLVYWLSRYGNVYSTHKSGDLFCTKPLVSPAIPLKKKI